jgi:drug/metabolite transporter (DMT)-like permease
MLGERPSPLAMAGGLLVVASVILISTGGTAALDAARLRAGLRYGLLTGALIAAYTLWDKVAVSGPARVPPLLEDYGSSVARVVVLAPLAWRRRDEVRGAWEAHRARVFGIAVLSPLAFILVLTAMVTAPVSYVAPAREVSILVGVALGVRVLAERQARRRMLASGLMFAGIVAIGLG